ncbi:MAG: hypothetical protein QW051_04775 [Candidatus Aenigmatarchaeota archaeon]
MIIDSLFFKPQIKKASIQLNPIDFTASGIQKYLKKNLKEDISEEIKKVEVNKRKGSVKVFFKKTL